MVVHSSTPDNSTCPSCSNRMWDWIDQNNVEKILHDKKSPIIDLELLFMILITPLLRPNIVLILVQIFVKISIILTLAKPIWSTELMGPHKNTNTQWMKRASIHPLHNKGFHNQNTQLFLFIVGNIFWQAIKIFLIKTSLPTETNKLTSLLFST